jgi:hypothetical protein
MILEIIEKSHERLSSLLKSDDVEKALDEGRIVGAGPAL